MSYPQPSNLTEDQKDDLRESLILIAISIVTRWKLRRWGLSKPEAYIAASALTSLAIINTRLKQLVKAQND